MTPFEAVVASELFRQGYDVLTSGWPDQLAINWETKKVRLIEVKGVGDTVRANQRKMHEAFRVMGFEVEVIQEDPNFRMTWNENIPSGSSDYRQSHAGRPNSAMKHALDFLQRELQDGDSASGLIARANTASISRATLYRAAVIAGIQMHRGFWRRPTTQEVSHGAD